MTFLTKGSTIGKPRIALAMGDAAGVSPKLAAKVLSDRAVRDCAAITVMGDARVLEAGARVAGVPLEIEVSRDGGGQGEVGRPLLSAMPHLERDGDGWRAQGPEGPIRITFSEHNNFGVMDHWIHLEDGRVVYVPLRIIANGDGSEVMLTLFRQPGMSDGKLAEDEAWIRRDLGVLKEFAESA